MEINGISAAYNVPPPPVDRVDSPGRTEAAPPAEQPVPETAAATYTPTEPAAAETAPVPETREPEALPPTPNSIDVIA